MTLHLRNGVVVAALVRALPELGGFDTTPRLAASDASAIVARGIGRAHLGAGAIWSAPRLEILSRPLLGGAPFPPRLAWFLEGRKIDLREYVWIDAQAGIVLLHFSQLTHARVRKVYDAASGSSLPGNLVRSEGGAATGDTDQDAAYDFAGDTYDYYFTQHGRDSYDDAGATIEATTDYCPDEAHCPFADAFWNGTQMVYGNGFPVADDVDAHELTHAVTERTSNLFNYMQSGALNESLSDIFGETIDLTNGAGTDTPGVRWLMGEDVPVLGAVRDMMDPTSFGDPGKMSDGQFVCETYAPDGDAGGVHHNSGVSNHAYALTVDGGSYNGQTVGGIGLTKAGKIWYRTESVYLVSSSDFTDMDASLRQSCSDLIGTASISAADCIDVGKALDAVEMTGSWNCTPPEPADAAVCPGGLVPGAYLFREDVEDAAKVASDWTVTGSDGVWANQGFDLGPFATSGTHNFWGYDPWPGSSTADSQLQMSRDVQVTHTDTYLRFNHSFGFEWDAGPAIFFDGGVIESSNDSGSSWSDAAGLIDSGAAYDGTIDNGFGNPLGGSSAFVGYSYGYTSTRLTLASQAGQTFRLRFRLAADDAFDDYGWFIDDIEIYRCLPNDLVFADGFEVGSTGEWSVTSP